MLKGKTLPPDPTGVAGGSIRRPRKPRFRHYLREWREHRGLGVRELARLLGNDESGHPLVSAASLSRIERGLQIYSQPILEALAVALKATPGALLSVDPRADRWEVPNPGPAGRLNGRSPRH